MLAVSLTCVSCVLVVRDLGAAGLHIKLKNTQPRPKKVGKKEIANETYNSLDTLNEKVCPNS